METTLNSLSIGNIQLFQPKNGYRYSIDPILLARFVKVESGVQVVDLGTGCGIIPIILAQNDNVAKFTGIECQSELATCAIENVKLNGLRERVDICHADIRDAHNFINPNSIDLIVSNPPYRRVGTGKIAPDNVRAAARHELAGGLLEFVGVAKRLLKHGGRYAVIYLPERLSELMVAMSTAGIEPKRLRLVYAYRGAAAKMVLLEGRKGGNPGLEIESPLYIYTDGDSCRDYTDEILQMYNGG